mmetsp:Transcript_44245/g.112061  ORF Transcript_44245/g.112061 Transcript_44245/m.112061 type:complete len:164 (-) Transcript_44245:1291-1782(-)
MLPVAEPGDALAAAQEAAMEATPEAARQHAEAAAAVAAVGTGAPDRICKGAAVGAVKAAVQEAALEAALEAAKAAAQEPLKEAAWEAVLSARAVVVLLELRLQVAAVLVAFPPRPPLARKLLYRQTLLAPEVEVPKVVLAIVLATPAVPLAEGDLLALDRLAS